MQVGLAAPSLFRTPGTAPALIGAAVIGISQSGRSPDVVGVLSAARAQNRPTIAITNDVTSPLAESADVVVPLDAGQERSVAATKTYLASLHAVHQILESLRPSADRQAWLERLPDVVDAMVEEHLTHRERFDVLANQQPITALGRGLDLANAHETALKIRELTGVITEAFSPPDLLHGPIAALRDGAAWVVSTTRAEPELSAVVETLRQRRLTLAIVSADAELLDLASLRIPLDAGLPQWVASVVSVIPAQAAALRLAELGRVDVDHPTGLSKVTLTA